MNNFELLLDRLIESEMQRKDLALSNQKLSYQYRELNKNSSMEINLLNSKITDYENTFTIEAKPKTK